MSSARPAGIMLQPRSAMRLLAILVLVLALSGLKLLDVPNEVLAVILAAAVVAGSASWFVGHRRATNALPATAPLD